MIQEQHANPDMQQRRKKSQTGFVRMRSDETMDGGRQREASIPEWEINQKRVEEAKLYITLVAQYD